MAFSKVYGYIMARFLFSSLKKGKNNEIKITRGSRIVGSSITQEEKVDQIRKKKTLFPCDHI